MSEIRFHPYIGPSFRKSVVRLLIVGESHYDEPDADLAECTRTVVEKWRTGEWGLRYLTIAARILTGLEAWEVDRRTALDTIAFYNFVQVLMPSRYVRPTLAQARSSWGAYREVLSTCDPTHIIATGRRFLWDNMPPTERGAGEADLGGSILPWREYATPSGYARTIALPHFSRASAPLWHAPVNAFLAERAVV